MSWRPKGWDVDKLVDKFDETKPANEFDYFEAGADAMLEALINTKTAQWRTYPPDGYVQGCKGWRVFIIDEEAKDE